MKYSFSKIVLFFTVGFFLIGCGGEGPKIVIPSYTPPKEASKLKQIETKDEFIAKGAYLAIWVNPDVKGVKSSNSKLSEFLHALIANKCVVSSHNLLLNL